MVNHSPIVTLANLNKVYKDIRDRIDALGDIYSPQGSLPFNQLLNLHVEYEDYNKLEPAIGHIYNITTPKEGTSSLPEGLSDGDNLVCINATFPESTLNTTKKEPESDSTPTTDPLWYGWYWARVGGIYEIATDNTAGLVYMGFGEDTLNEGVTSETKEISRGLKNSTSASTQTGTQAGGNSQASYITIPIASEGIYGLVSTESQTFAGDKTFKGSIIVSSSNSGGNSSEIPTTITPTSISVGSSGSTTGTTTTGVLNVNGSSSIGNNSNLGKLISGETNVNAVAGEFATLEISGSGKLTIEGVGSSVETLDVKTTATIGNLNTSNLVSINQSSEYTTDVAVFDKLNASTVNITEANSKLSVTGTLSANTVTTDYLTYNGKDENENPLNGNYINYGGGSVSVKNIVVKNIDGNNVDNGTLETKDIHATTVYANNIGTTSGPVKTITVSTINSEGALYADSNSTIGTDNNRVHLTLKGADASLEVASEIKANSLDAAGSIKVSKELTVPTLTLSGGSLIAINDKVDLTATTLEAKDTESLASIKTNNLTVPTLEFSDIKSSLKVTNPVILETKNLKDKDTELTLASINADTLTVPTLEFSNAGSSLKVTNEVTNTVTTLTLSDQDKDKDTALNVDTLTVPTLTVTGTLNAGAVSAPDQTITVTGNINAKAVTITGKQEGNTTTGGNLNVTKKVDVNILAASSATLTVEGKSANTNTLDVDGTLNVTDTTADAASVEKLVVEGTLKVTNTGADAAEVNKLTAYNATLTVEGDKVTANTLDVTGNLTVNSSATIGSNTSNNGTIIVHGPGSSNISRPSDADYTSLSGTNVTISTNGGIYATKVFNAVWNDLADSIEVPEDTELEYGYCYSYLDGKVFKSNKKADAHVLGIHSDTAGMVLGTKPGKCIDLAVAGIVLAYVDKEYISGTPLVATKEGKLTKASFFNRILHPERIVATFYKKETLDRWGSKEGGHVEVNGRCWVKVN